VSAEQREESWLDAFQRAFNHVPLNLYDEDQKPAERAITEMLAELQAAQERERKLRQAMESVLAWLGQGQASRNDEWARKRIREALAAQRTEEAGG
jgi:hypothetical protein